MKITIGIPSYLGTIHIATQRSLLSDIALLSAEGVKVDIDDDTGSALIADSRAKIFARFLESGNEYLMYVDSDICWEPGAIPRLVKHPVDFVGGCYPYRTDISPDSASPWPIVWDTRQKILPCDPQTGLIRVIGLPGGFMRISRRMAERMIEHYPKLCYRHDGAPDNKAWALFGDYWLPDTEHLDVRTKLSEDLAFCRRWIDIGGKVWLDPEITFGHMGIKTYVGHIGDWLKERKCP